MGVRCRFRSPEGTARLDSSHTAEHSLIPLSPVTRFCPPIAMLLLAAGCASRTHSLGTGIAVDSGSISVSSLAVPATPDTAPRRDLAPAPVVTDSEVITRAAAIFDGVPAATSTAPASGPMVGDGRATWDIDVRSYETHEMVSQYVGIFTGRARGYMEKSMSMGTRFDAMLRRKFRESGLPEDMTYLALIESSYSPHAYSHAAAVGMWQFMAPTARGIGMRVDWWVDERRDPMRATDGAIDFLIDLHEAYGSWYLAAAAYNGGPGRVSRGLKRFSDEMDGSAGEDRFFALAEQRYLPSETKAYVPKLIAAAMIAKEPTRYGLHVDTLPPYLYDSVMVNAGTSLAAVATAASTTLDVIKDLNPHYLRGVAPPGEWSEIRVPVGASASFDSVMKAMPDSERLGWREVRLATARSSQAIADDAGIPVKAIRWVNPKLEYDRRGRVKAGTLLRIPTVLAVAGARDVPDPLIARYGSSTSLVSRRVRVRAGESLASVARRSGVSVASLRALNGIKGNRVRAGQVLVVHRPSKRTLAAARRSAASRARSRSAVKGRTSSGKSRAATKAGGKHRKHAAATKKNAARSRK